MGILVQNDWRNKAIFGLIILMLASLFVSRAFLSVSLIAFVAVTTLHTQLWSQLKTAFRSPLLVCLMILFFIPLISGLWSTDLEEWGKVLLIKLPFLMLPLAFAGRWQVTEKNWLHIAFSFLLFTILACCWSLGQYFMEMRSIHESYLRAKTIPTPLDDDHVRFSWLVCLAVIMSVLILDKFPVKRKSFVITSLVFLVVYLHILSARTGLVMLYVFAVGFAFYKLKHQPRFSLLAIGSLIVLLLAGWFCFPTFQNRIKYNLWDLSLVLKNEYRSGTSDGNRFVSFKAGWHLLQANPLVGVGAGDVRNETNHWYDSNVKGIQETDKLYPSSEWLVYGGMAGWPGVLVFTGVIFFPLYLRNIRYRFFWIMLHAVAILGFSIETSLEMQHGVFIYVFFMLWWWKWCKQIRRS